MNPDWEFVSTQLEFLLTGLFPTMERIDLLDKYNFLALPGTKEQKLRDKDNILRKARYYNYECIREAVISHNIRFTPILAILFKTMDNRDKSLDKLLEQCNRRNIELRLGSNWVSMPQWTKYGNIENIEITNYKFRRIKTLRRGQCNKITAYNNSQ